MSRPFAVHSGYYSLKFDMKGLDVKKWTTDVWIWLQAFILYPTNKVRIYDCSDVPQTGAVCVPHETFDLVNLVGN